MKSLSKKELLFCRLYASGGNGREAAFKAGYTVCPEICAKKLLADAGIKKEVGRLRKEFDCSANEVRTGLRRLAFSSPADAVKLILSDSPESIEPESLDLFCVSEIKRPKGGGLEIKFFDRIKALEKLGEYSLPSEEKGTLPFYQALEKSAEALRSEDSK